MKFYINRLILLCTIVISIQFSFAQNTNCNCDYTIDPALANGISLAPWKTGSYKFNPPPGSIVCLKGIYNDLRIEGIAGTATAPIIIRNFCDSVAQFVNTTRAPLSLTNCKYVRLTGSNVSPSVNYGITVESGGAQGINITGTDVRGLEIDRVEVKKSGFAGFMIKQDPTCDPKTWRDSMAYYDISLHHNYIHDVTGEGFYIGNTFFTAGVTRSCSGQNIRIFPHRIYGLKVYNNIFKNTGYDGIQYGCAPDADVHDNVIENTGLLKVSQQTNGVQIGEGSGGLFYNNIIRNPGSTGLAMIGFTDSLKVYNNLIINAFEGIFADTRDSVRSPKIELEIYNNTLVNMQDNGMKIYDHGHQFKNNLNQWVFFPKGYQPRIKNNVIIGPYFELRLILLDPAITMDSTSQYKLITPFSSAPQYFVAEKGQLFADTASYQLKANSFLIDKGTSAVANLVLADIMGVPRPQGGLLDIGAYEFVVNNPPPAAPITEMALKDESFIIYPTLANEFINIEVNNLSSPSDLVITDLSGRVFLNKKIDNNIRNIDIKQLKSGFYVCNLKNNQSNKSMKFYKL